jgi:hypothetical protein
MIMAGQIYTIVNASGNTTQTLPLISSVLEDMIANPYEIYNYSPHEIVIQGSGSDLVDGQSSITILLIGSLTLLPTPLVWLLI